MGLLKDIGKAFGKVWKGITKVFKAILKPVAKFFSSDIGKALMIGVSIFTLGTSLLAGAQGFMAGQGFLGKFVNGGKEFLNSLLGTQFETATNAAGEVAGQAAGAAGELAAENAVAAGDLLTNAADVTAQGANAAGVTGAAPSTLGRAGELANAAPGSVANMNAMNSLQKAATPVANVASSAAKEPGWLQKAASAAFEFAKSPSGQTVIGNTLAGAAAGAQQKEMLEHERRVERMFEDPNDPGMKMLREHDYSIDVPTSLSAASSRLAQREAERSGRYTPNVPYMRPISPGG